MNDQLGALGAYLRKKTFGWALARTERLYVRARARARVCVSSATIYTKTMGNSSNLSMGNEFKPTKTKI